MGEQPKEPLPVDEAIQVIDYRNIYKTSKWWCAVLLGNMFGHDKIMVYLWQWNDKTGKWKRKQKMGINFEKDWEKIKSAVEEFLPRIRTATG
jgi:hypothetical protein